MRFRLFLAVLFSFFCISTAHAEDSAPPPDGPGTPPPPGAVAKPPVARREEDDGATDTAGLLARLKAWGTGKNDLADQITGLQRKLQSTEAALQKATDENAALKAENEQLRKDVAAFGAWLETHGAGERPAGESAAGKAASEAIGAGVAAEVRKLGIPTAKVTTPAAGANGGASDEDDLSALIEEMGKTSDPAAKGRLCAKIAKLREKIGSN